MHLDTERERYQKVILCIFAALTVIFAIWTAISRSHEGVTFRETLLDIQQEANQTVYTGKLYSTPFSITCWEENGVKRVTFAAEGAYHANCRVEYPAGTITTEYGNTVERIRVFCNEELLFSGGYDPDPPSNSHLHYYDENGAWDPMISIQAGGSGNPWHYFSVTASDIIRFANGPQTAVRGSWTIYFVALLITAIGAVLTAFPNTLFFLRHCCDVRDPEPTDFYYTSHKIGCVIYVGLSLFAYIKGVCVME